MLEIYTSFAQAELVLVKADGRSWPSLEYEEGLSQPTFTFGVQGERLPHNR